MPRSLRRVDAGLIYHILNRGNGRRMLFAKDADYLAFFKMLNEGFDPRLRLTSSLTSRGRPRKPLAELSPRQKRRRAASPIGHK
jgi:hypothetical protein